MANRPNQKIRLLYLLKTFMDKTDETHGLTTQQIIEELAYFDLEAERKAIYRDIRALNEFGFGIEQRGGKDWYLAKRPLELQELTMMVDAVQSAPFLTEEITDQLIGKLRQFASKEQRDTLRRRIEVPGRVKMQNQSVLENLDIIQQAIWQKHKLEFCYYHYDAKKKRVLNQDGKTYVVTPVRLVYAGEFYYLIAFMDRWANEEGHQPFAPYRVDRMTDMLVSDLVATKDPRIATYVTEDHLSPSFGIFAADKVSVTLEFDERAMNPIIDKFGIDALVFQQAGERIRAHVKAPLSPQFFGWLVQLGTLVKITQPDYAVKQFARHLRAIRNVYEKEAESK